MKLYNKLYLKPLRKNLRKNLTDAERAVWNIIRNRQILNQKFFRQYSVDKYILDFYCPKIKLAIEIDGGQHNYEENKKADELRSKYLKSVGIYIIRFWNNEVLLNANGVYITIYNKITELLPSSSL